MVGRDMERNQLFMKVENSRKIFAEKNLKENTTPFFLCIMLHFM